MISYRLTDHQHARLSALAEVVDQCRNVIEAYEKRAEQFPTLTMNEAQEIAVLRIRLDDLSDLQAIGRAERF